MFGANVDNNMDKYLKFSQWVRWIKEWNRWFKEMKYYHDCGSLSAKYDIKSVTIKIIYLVLLLLIGITVLTLTLWSVFGLAFAIVAMVFILTLFFAVVPPPK